MSSSPTDPADELQFQTVEPVNPASSVNAGRHCVVCQRPIQSMYFAVRDKTLCPDCAKLVQAGPQGAQSVRLLRGLLFGILAAIPGAILWGAILYFTQYQIGYVALLVGYMVGKGVRKGSGGRGGPFYQAIALGVTYLAAASAYLPFFFEIFIRRDHLSPLESIVNSLIPAIKAPIAEVAENPIGLVILGIGMWEAWKFTKFVPIPLTGPYLVAPASHPLLPATQPAGDSPDAEVVI